MAFEFEPPDGGDKKHHKQSHSDTDSKLHKEAHGLLDKLHHDWQKVKPHLEHAAHGAAKTVEHQAKSIGGTAQRELNGTATASDNRKLRTVETIAGVALPQVTIIKAAVTEGSHLIKKHGAHTNVHIDVHTPVNHGVNHGGSKH
ncbi:MAG: hypothetical protein JST89_06450 [Cyanobacteria bacterium SZAS-4]|nr:hypothetical protein [Cyanobacteria bacterium SZAS-4]